MTNAGPALPLPSVAARGDSVTRRWLSLLDTWSPGTHDAEARENQKALGRMAKDKRQRSKPGAVRNSQPDRRIAGSRTSLTGTRERCSLPIIVFAARPIRTPLEKPQSRRAGPALRPSKSRRRKKKFYDRSHDVYENKGQVLAMIDCSHDLYENKQVKLKSRRRPRCY